MPELDGEIKAKISALRAKSDGWESIEVFEFIKIEWFSGARFYSVTAIDDLHPNLPVEVEARLISDSYPDYFLGIDSTSSLGDEEVDLKFWDADGDIADLVYESGEGIKVELFYYFPAVDLMLSHWWGHLRTDENSDAGDSGSITPD